MYYSHLKTFDLIERMFEFLHVMENVAEPSIMGINPAIKQEYYALHDAWTNQAMLMYIFSKPSVQANNLLSYLEELDAGYNAYLAVLN